MSVLIAVMTDNDVFIWLVRPGRNRNGDGRRLPWPGAEAEAAVAVMPAAPAAGAAGAAEASAEAPAETEEEAGAAGLWARLNSIFIPVCRPSSIIRWGVREPPTNQQVHFQHSLPPYGDGKLSFFLEFWNHAGIFVSFIADSVRLTSLAMSFNAQLVG